MEPPPKVLMTDLKFWSHLPWSHITFWALSHQPTFTAVCSVPQWVCLMTAAKKVINQVNHIMTCLMTGITYDRNDGLCYDCNLRTTCSLYICKIVTFLLCLITFEFCLSSVSSSLEGRFLLQIQWLEEWELDGIQIGKDLDFVADFNFILYVIL